jgi:hypothetical protein
LIVSNLKPARRYAYAGLTNCLGSGIFSEGIDARTNAATHSR